MYGSGPRTEYLSQDDDELEEEEERRLREEEEEEEYLAEVERTCVAAAVVFTMCRNRCS